MVTSAVQSAQPYAAHNSIICMHYVLSVNSEKGFLETQPKIVHKGLFYRIKDVPAILFNSISEVWRTKTGSRNQLESVPLNWKVR